MGVWAPFELTHLVSMHGALKIVCNFKTTIEIHVGREFLLPIKSMWIALVMAKTHILSNLSDGWKERTFITKQKQVLPIYARWKLSWIGWIGVQGCGWSEVCSQMLGWISLCFSTRRCKHMRRYPINLVHIYWNWKVWVLSKKSVESKATNRVSPFMNTPR